MRIKKNSPIIKAMLVLIVGSILGYLGLNVPQSYIEEVVDEQLGVFIDDSVETGEPSLVSYRVLSVIDGDTFVIAIAGEPQTVRVLGIDTPETEYSPVGAECYGEEATERAKMLLLGNEVILRTDLSQATTDTYDRLLAYVKLEDGKDFGEVMIGEGYAKEYTYKRSAYENQKRYRNLENQAQRKSIGIWECSE